MTKVPTPLLALAICAPLAHLTGCSESGAIYQWHGAGDLGAAIEACRRHDYVTGVVDAFMLGLEQGSAPHSIESEVEGTESIWESQTCMEKHGFTLDTTIQDPRDNPQFVAYYERLSGIRLKSAEERRAEAVEQAAAEAARPAQEAAQLARCESATDLTVGDLETCKEIRERS